MFFNNINVTQLSEEQKQLCEGQITIDECKGILETFQNNKSLRNDGIPIEFYKKSGGHQEGATLVLRL